MVIAFVKEMLREFSDDWRSAFLRNRLCDRLRARIAPYSELYFRHCEGKIEGAPMSVAPADQPLYQIVSGAAPVTIDEGIEADGEYRPASCRMGMVEVVQPALPDGDT